MKRVVITYGTFDMLHIGHLNILRRAKALGKYLIVGVTSEDYDRSRGKLNVSQETRVRVKAVEQLEFVDKVIIEKHKGQKIQDIQNHNVDTFVIGDDWVGKFDYLREYCHVEYLPRTEGVSSTMLRKKNIKTIKLGIVGTGRIAKRFLIESKHVCDIEIHSAMSRNMDNVQKFIEEGGIPYGYDNIERLLEDNIDAVYIASPHQFHYLQAKKALKEGKHVLCEKPITLEHEQLVELVELARCKKLILMEAIKTAFFPAFTKVLEEINKGKIGEIKEVRSTFTKLIKDKSVREWTPPYGGSTNELSSYPLLLAHKILGESTEINFYDQIEGDVDIANRIVCTHKKGAFSISTVAIGAKGEGSAVISGTEGYIYIPAPWWLTKEFYIRYEDPSINAKYLYDFEGDGIRYEISEFMTNIQRNKTESSKLISVDMLEINKIISLYNSKRRKDKENNRF
ncbi:MAG: Gfo/Idh/MocA family oxidoreductase [Cocleimonas sp.]